MRVKCVDASNDCGTGDGLLTQGKVYPVIRNHGGYYILICDDGKEYTKLKRRFTSV